MAPMTQQASPGVLPGPDVEYYRRRAAGGQLIITEGIRLPDPAAATRRPSDPGPAPRC